MRICCLLVATLALVGCVRAAPFASPPAEAAEETVGKRAGPGGGSAATASVAYASGPAQSHLSGARRQPTRTDAQVTSLDRAALASLAAGAESSGTDALIVLHQGRVVVERYRQPADPRPIPLRSITKSVVSLVIGQLLGSGRIESLDTPLSRWYPEWGVGRRTAVTLRHVMAHSSGLEHHSVDLQLYAQRDTVRYARSLALVHPPGQRHEYNNEAVQLLVGVIRAAAGEPLEQYARVHLFEPLGIEGASWERDLAGNCLAYAGLSLRPRELARLGQLMVQRGSWNGRQVVPKRWFDRATRPASEVPAYGLLLELFFDSCTHVSTERSLAALSQFGITFARKLRPLLERPFHYRAEYWLEAGALLSRAERQQLVVALEAGQAPLPFESRPGRLSGFGHSGTYGQYLMVYPDYGLVVVRLVRQFDASRSRVDFEEQVLALLRRTGLARPAG